MDIADSSGPALQLKPEQSIIYSNRQLQSPFFNKLPCELRLEIYKLVFTVPVHIEVGEHASWDDLKQQFSILLTCKRLCVEAQDIPFEINTFRDSLWSYKACRLEDSRARNVAPRICHLQLNFHAWRYLDFKCPLVNDFKELREQIANFKQIFNQCGNLRSLEIHIHEYNGNKDLLERGIRILEDLKLGSCRVTIANWAVAGVSEECVEELSNALNVADAVNGGGGMWAESATSYRVVEDECGVLTGLH
ncbi:hypothetical protein NA57DRAFT_51064 [Rhizodiscina lignyota]|uniref:Uncharacterized protein n=1 Tax=Rhizodiscina lignyota TaxID=1504668 RepID=A0A9P4ITK1_9PEZI|nr:hypothetical protein NA57DRAFT_51064 [Rhizodiscina lignyota]